MQITPQLRPAIPMELNPSTDMLVDVLPESQQPSVSRLCRAGAVLTAATVLAACGTESYNTSNLASAPHGATVELPKGTVVVYEAFEETECSRKKGAMGAAESTIIVPAGLQPTTSPSKSSKSSKSPKARTYCEGAEVEVEACQPGATPDANPETVAPSCVLVDIIPGDFESAAGLTISEVTTNQRITLITSVHGIADKD